MAEPQKTLKNPFLPFSLINQKHLHTIPQVFLKSMQHFRRTSVNKIFVTQKGKVEGKLLINKITFNHF